jgi:putative ABC transport system permease protein
MTVSRWVLGVAAIGGSVALAGIFATAHSADAASLILLVAMLLGLAPSVRVVVPWLPLGGIALACLAIAVVASLVPAALVLRRRPAELAAVPE